MKEFYEFQEFQNMIDKANHVISQIEKLRVDISNKLHMGKRVEEKVLYAMGESMRAIADMLEMPLQNEEMNNLYSNLQSGILVADICDWVLVWEENMYEWMDSLSERYGICNICKKMVCYCPNNTHFGEEQRKHNFPYWNMVFESIGKEKRGCPVCRSMDRERMISLMIDLLHPAGGEKLKVLQIAPSLALDNWLSSKDYMIYETTDLMMSNVTFQSDIQNMYMVEDETYDIVICSHILEHVENDRKAMSELYRVLKPEGVCLFLVPLIMGLDKTDEAFGMTPEENWERFGQDDHARLYAKEDFLNRLVDVGFMIHVLDKEYFGEEIWRDQGLTDIHYLYAATKSDIGIGVEPYQPEIKGEELVSVVIPTYNRGYCIERAVNSVLKQTWNNLEVIVVDDASVDNTEEVIRSIEDSRVKYIKVSENKGANHARNVGVINSKGSYIAFNDSDDEWLPQKLEKQMKQLRLADKTERNIGCVYCVVTKYDNGKVVEVAPDLQQLGEKAIGDIYRFMQSNMFISTQTLLMKREVFDEVGLFNEELERLQDWELLLRVAQKYKFTLVQESLVNAYIQKDCISKNVKGWINTVFYVIEKHKMQKNNKAACRKLLTIALNMINNSQIDSEYVQQVLERIEKFEVFPKKCAPLKTSGSLKISEMYKCEKAALDTSAIEVLQEEIKGMKSGIEENNRLLNELLWAQVFNSTQVGVPWLKNEVAFWPGRWGVGYQYMYVITRLLSELQPCKILETGLGQSTRLIASYCKWMYEKGQKCEHFVIEHDHSWIDIFLKGFQVSEATRIVQRDLAYVGISKASREVGTYIYKGMDEIMQGKKFNFISLDAPYGTDDIDGYSRIDIVHFLPECLEKDFCIVLDDYNRWGEKNTVEHIKMILARNGIAFKEAVYRGMQDMYMLTSDSWSYLCTL